MCQICQNIHTKAQHNAFVRIKKREEKRVFKKLDLFKTLLKRKFFPEDFSYDNVAFSQHDHKTFTGNSFRSFPSELEEERDWIKEKNKLYFFPLWGQYKIVFLSQRVYYQDGDRANYKSSGGRLFYNLPPRYIKLLKEIAVEVPFPNV